MAHGHFIDSVDDYSKHKPELINYLTNEFFRVLENPADKNSPRAPVALWWYNVQTKFLKGFDTTFNGEELKRADRLPRSFDQCVKQAMGCLKSAFVCYPGKEIMNLLEFQQAMLETVKRNMLASYESYKEQRKAYLADFEPLTYENGKFDDLSVLAYRDKVYNKQQEEKQKN